MSVLSEHASNEKTKKIQILPQTEKAVEFVSMLKTCSAVNLIFSKSGKNSFDTEMRFCQRVLNVPLTGQGSEQSPTKCWQDLSNFLGDPSAISFQHLLAISAKEKPKIEKQNRRVGRKNIQTVANSIIDPVLKRLRTRTRSTNIVYSTVSCCVR